MKNFRRLLIVLVICLSCKQNDSNNSLLWKIEGNSIKTSYLYGTTHYIAKADFILKEKVRTALDKTEILVLESDHEDSTYKREINELIYLDKTDSLESYMTDKEEEIINGYLKENVGASLKSFNNLKPFILFTTIIASFHGTETTGYEKELIKIFKKENKKILGLELPSDSAPIFDIVPYDKQVDQIVEFLEDMPKTTSLFKGAISAYLEEDIQYIYDFTNEYLAIDKKMSQAILDNRNKNWLPKITQYATDRNTFFAVGSAHLYGEIGLINLLKDQGYAVTPVFD